MLPVLVFFGSLAAAWYLLITRPQREHQGRHTNMVGELSVGQCVMTVGGLFGRILSIDNHAVVLELAEGMHTRISTDGIARIASPHEASLPTAPPAATPAAPPVSAPPVVQQQPQPIQPAAPWPAPAPQQVVAFNPAAHVPTQVHVAPASGFQPQPWSPNLPAPVQPGQPFQFSMGGLMPQTTPAPAPVVHQVAPSPDAPIAVPPVHQHEAGHRHVHAEHQSVAPQGMGQSVRRDDAQMQQIFDRARGEREELALEYQRITAPLVAAPVSPDAPVAVIPPAQQIPAASQLFIHQTGGPVAPTAVFPAAARPPQADGGIPRPSIAHPQLDEQTQRAFQRRAPYGPTSGAASGQ